MIVSFCSASVSVEAGGQSPEQQVPLHQMVTLHEFGMLTIWTTTMDPAGSGDHNHLGTAGAGGPRRLRLARLLTIQCWSRLSTLKSMTSSNNDRNDVGPNNIGSKFNRSDSSQSRVQDLRVGLVGSPGVFRPPLLRATLLIFM